MSWLGFREVREVRGVDLQTALSGKRGWERKDIIGGAAVTRDL